MVERGNSRTIIESAVNLTNHDITKKRITEPELGQAVVERGDEGRGKSPLTPEIIPETIEIENGSPATSDEGGPHRHRHDIHQDLTSIRRKFEDHFIIIHRRIVILCPENFFAH
jgi:hypothetical protein